MGLSAPVVDEVMVEKIRVLEEEEAAYRKKGRECAEGYNK